MVAKGHSSAGRVDLTTISFHRSPRMALSNLPLTAARWFLLANIVLAAWLYGGTREWAREWVTWLLLANTGLFILGLLAQGRPPRISWVAAAAVAFLLLQGWFMTWNANHLFLDAARVFVDRPQQPMPGWPGFMDVAMIVPQMLLTTGLLGAFCIACDLTANRVWRDRLWHTLAGTGLSLVLLGLVQRLTEAPSIFWDVERNLGATFFAVFRYHANAGTFLNLVMPLMAGLAVRAFARPGAERERVFWTLASATTAAAGFVNVSRAANVICVLLLLGIAAWIAARRMRATHSHRLSTGLAIATLIAATTALLAYSFGMEKTLARWEIGVRKGTSFATGRHQAGAIIIQSALPASGAWGFGPGTFEPMFNIHRARAGSPLAGRWDKAHSDALQTPMEWGWAGAGAWAVLLLGAMLRAVRSAWRGESDESKILPTVCAFSLVGVLLHALADFPLQIPALQLFTLLIAGIAWSLPARA